MIKKVVKYTDFNDMERTDELYFHMTQPELIKLSVSKEGGFERYIDRMIQSNNMKELVAVLEEVIQLTYGVKTDDGRFEKSPEILQKFLSSEAYNVVFMDIAQNAETAAEFINGVIPKNLKKQVDDALAAQQAQTPTA